MQVHKRTLRTVVAVLAISLVLSACSGGGGGGSTWFNLPSIPITLDANGNGKVLGFNIGYLGLQPAMIGQLQQANVQEIEIRVGYHGIFPYANGEALPYINWTDESVNLLQDVLRNTPGAETGATAIPWLRRIGVGVRLKLPLAQGASPLDIPRWRGEELAQPETPGETTIGPIQFASLAYDENGKPSIEGVPLAQIEQALGASLGLDLPPLAMQIFKAINVQQLTVATQPNGIDLSVDGRPLPGLAYDTPRLERTIAIAEPLVGDPTLVSTLKEVAPKLPGADVDIIVSFTGQPAADTKLATIPVQVTPEGALAIYGIPLGTSPILPQDMLAKLQAANIQKLDVSILQDSLYLAANREPLPVIAWSDATLEAFQEMGGDLLGVPPGLLNGGLAIVRALVAKTPIGLSMDLPVAEGAEALTFEGEFDVTAVQFQPSAVEGAKPELQLGVVFDPSGNLVSLAGIPASTLAAVGAPAINLPPNVQGLLSQLGAGKLQVATADNALNIMADDARLLGLQYDNAALERALGLASAFVADPAQLESVGAVLPQVLNSDLNLVVSLTGEPAAETRLTSLPIAVRADGTLAVYGFALGDQPILQKKFIDDMQAINVQRIDANIINDNLYLATNGEALPVISWNDRSLDLIQEVAGSALGVSPDLLGAAIGFLKDSDVGLALSLPAAEGAEAVSVPESFDVTAVAFQPPALGDLAQPLIQLGIVLQGNQIASISDIPASTLQAMGVSLPALPENIANILNGLGAEQLQLTAMPNALQLAADSESLLGLAYDDAALNRLIKLATPFLSANVAEVFSDPDVTALLTEQLLPLVSGADVDITAVLE